MDKGYEPAQHEESSKLFGDTISADALKSLFDHVKSVHADQQISVEHDPQHSWLTLKM